MNTVFLNGLTDLFDKPNGTVRIDQVLCGVTATILEQQKDWDRVQLCTGYSGWTRKSHLRQIAKRNTWNLAPKQMVVQATADVQSLPQVQASFLGMLVRGCIVGALGPATPDGWQHVCLPEGTAGWMPASTLMPMPSFEGIPEAELRCRLTGAMRSYLGVQYRWGGKSPLGVDCSGLVQVVYRLCGINVWRDAEIRPGYAIHQIDRADMQPADLLYFPGHVAMYMGSNTYIHATAHIGDNKVTINSLDPVDKRYRPDLAEHIEAVGSVFPLTRAAAFSLQ